MLTCPLLQEIACVDLDYQDLDVKPKLVLELEPVETHVWKWGLCEYLLQHLAVEEIGFEFVPKRLFEDENHRGLQDGIVD